MPLTIERLKEALFYDPISGAWTWRIRCGRQAPGTAAGTKPKSGDLRIGLDGTFYCASVLAAFYMTGEMPPKKEPLYLDPDYDQRRKREHRLANLERLRQKDRERYATNLEAAREKNRVQYAKRPDFHKERHKRWRARHPDEVRSYCRKRRAQILGAEGSHSVEDIKSIFSLQKGRCAACRCKLGDSYEIDHITALSKGGSNSRRNLQLLCGPCNRSKKDADPAEFYRRKGLLI